METIARTRKIGGSLVVTIPKEITETEGLLPNQFVKINVNKIKASGFGISKGLASFTKEDKFRGQLEEDE